MGHKFERVIGNSGYRLTDKACDELKSQFKIDDVRSQNIVLGNSLIFQFFAHWAYDSFEKDGERFNRYDAQTDGSFGVYSERQMGSPLMKNGYFKLLNGNQLPVLMSDDDSDGKTEVTPDLHRANENFALKAFHLMASKLHNHYMGVYGDYEEAKAANVATWNRLFLDAALELCQMDEEEFFSDMKVQAMNKALEFNFSIGRWAHSQMTDTVNGLPIFQRRSAHEVDMRSLFDGSEMSREINMGVSTAMTQMHHTGDPISILTRTITNQHNDLQLASFDQLSVAYGIPSDIGLSNCPMWPGILKEAELYGNGYLGPVGRRAVADGIAGTMLWGVPNQGLWHKRYEGAPDSMMDVINLLNY